MKFIQTTKRAAKKITKKMRTSRLIAYFRGTIKHPVLLMILRAAPYALICIVIAVVFSRYVPINMDEFVQYHPLLCHFYPLNTLNIYREPCGLYDLDLLGTGLVLPLRAFGYTGSIVSVLYTPLFLLWRDVESARLFGCLLLTVQAFCLAKIFRCKMWIAFAGISAFFPYAF